MGLQLWARWAAPAALLLIPGAASPQSVRPGLPGPYVIDLRAAMSGLPASAAFQPPIPEKTLVPSRGFGVDVGGHVYAGGIGPARLGFGVNVVWARGTADTPAPVTSSSAPATSGEGTGALSAASPIRVAMGITAIAPQVSFNWGNSDGWSYLGGGYGVAWINTDATGTRQSPASGSATLEHDTGAMGEINYGGGARWFLRTRTAVGFDLRFHRLAGTASRPATTLVMASVGVSLR